MTRKFAKLYEVEELGQILVTIDWDESNRDKVAVKFQIELEDFGLGVCQNNFKFPDTDEGWDNAEAYFESVDEKHAVKVANQIIESLKELGA